MTKRLKVLLVLLALAISAHIVLLIHLVTGDIGRIYPVDKRTNIDIKDQKSFYAASVLSKGLEIRTLLDENYMDKEFQFSFHKKPAKYLDDLKIVNGTYLHTLTYNNQSYTIDYNTIDADELYKGIWKHLSSGHSSGMMLVLQKLQSVTEEDITAGYKIAGTGDYWHCMRVDMVASIYEKLKAAHKNEMDYFLVAGDNYEEAEKIKAELDLEIEIIPVFFIQEAVEFLEQLK